MQMYPILLLMHSFLRWMVLASLLVSIVVAYRGHFGKKHFTETANGIRHWTATIVQVQLLLGMSLYFQSPIVRLVAPDYSNGLAHDQNFFFRYFHAAMMFFAVVIVTTGSAKAKRMETDAQKYLTMLRWFSAALLILFLAIPWPFSPFVARPYFRLF